MDERRKHVRVRREQPCAIVIEGTYYPAYLVDISLRGALLTLPTALPIPMGATLTLEIPLDENMPETIVMTGDVAGLRNGRLALLCRTIDVDSMTHLRRLLELNTGDPALIERELSALGE